MAKATERPFLLHFRTAATGRSVSGPASFVVGLGASAGGLEALEKFFDNCPYDSGGAFVVVMHLSRSFKSMLDELLARHTQMVVKPAEHREQLRANTVYVIPPATILEVNGHEFVVKVRPIVHPGGPATNIDTLFHSIAEHWKNRSGAVILSGSGADGSKGAIAIHKAGGFVCTQSPETAKFDSMPLAVIASSSLRAVEAPEQLAQTVVDGILLPRLTPSPPITSDYDAALGRILDAVIGASQTPAGQYKYSTFERRVHRRMMDLKMNSIRAYADRIENDATEALKLSQTLLIGVTEFFRDPSAFKVIAQQVVPELIRRAQVENRPIRIWVPGCATGEEAYSLTMLFVDALSNISQNIELQVFATDLKQEFLSVAARGEYPEERIEKIPGRFRRKFFKRVNGSGPYAVDQSLRKPLVFAPHDLLTDPPFTRLDLISCRNLLIYFSVEAQQRILNNFAFGLAHQGFLFLGPSETIGGHREAFDYIDARSRIFRRTSSKKHRPYLPEPMSGQNIPNAEHTGLSRVRSAPANLPATRILRPPRGVCSTEPAHFGRAFAAAQLWQSPKLCSPTRRHRQPRYRGNGGSCPKNPGDRWR